MYKYQYRQQQHEAQCDLRPDSDFNRLVTRRKRTHESESETDSVPVTSREVQERVEFEPDNDDEETQSSIRMYFLNSHSKFKHYLVSLEPPPQATIASTSSPMPLPQPTRQIAFANDDPSDLPPSTTDLNIVFPQHQYPHDPLEDEQGDANNDDDDPGAVTVKMEDPPVEDEEVEEESESRAELIEDGHKRFVKLYNSDGTFKIYKLDDKPTS